VSRRRRQSPPPHPRCPQPEALRQPRQAQVIAEEQELQVVVEAVAPRLRLPVRPSALRFRKVFEGADS